MEKKISYNFSFTVDGIAFSFNVFGDTQKDALELLRAQLGKIMAEINMEINMPD